MALTDGLTFFYSADAYATVTLTGHRIPEAADAIGEWTLTSDCRIPLAAWSAYDVSLAHAFWEADSLCEWTFFVGALSPADRGRARELGLLH